MLDFSPMTMYNNFRLIRRSRVAGRARTIGNRVTIKSGSRVRIPPSPPNKNELSRKAWARFYFCDIWEGFEVGAVVNECPVDTQSRERPSTAVRESNPSFSAKE